MATQLSLFEKNTDPAASPKPVIVPIKKTAFVGWMVVQDGPGTKQWKHGKGYVDAIICWGAGMTEIEALQDSLPWISSSQGLTHIETTDHILEDGRFMLRRCTRASMAHLKEYGSDFDFVIINGQVLLNNESVLFVK